jgi:Cu/Ag efflux pump CusA
VKEVLTGKSESIVVRIFGPELEVLREQADKVEEALTGIDGLVELHEEPLVDIPQVQITVDLAKAGAVGLAPGDVRRDAAILFSGHEVTDIHAGDKVYDVMVWSTPETRHSPLSVREALLDTPAGGQVRLGDIADVRIVPSPNQIVREGASRRIDVLANVGSGRDLGAVLEDVEDRLEEVQFPLGYHAELLGEGAERAAAQRRLLLAGLAAVVGIFLLLQAAFRSWRLATLAFLALPAALVGGVLAAYAGDGIVSLGALVGFLAVLGIAARNSILLIRHFQHLEWVEGEAFGPALVLRGARERLSPILMTTLATGLALVPLVFAADLPGHEIEHPMAVVILGGLVTSTLLNLFVVPALYLRLGSIRESDLSSELAALQPGGRAGFPGYQAQA